MIKRKGARSIKNIPKDILTQLNLGKIETVNLTEWLAVDQKLLLENFLKENNRITYLKPILSEINQLKKQTVNTVNNIIGTTIYNIIKNNNDDELLSIMCYHQADLVRCWATYIIGKNEKLNIDETLKKIKLFSADKHFGVREISWMAVRTKINNDLEKSITILSNWTTHEDENIRRFTTESTRPRGVWSEL